MTKIILIVILAFLHLNPIVIKLFTKNKEKIYILFYFLKNCVFLNLLLYCILYIINILVDL